MKISRWDHPGIDVYSIPRICQPARNSPGIDFFGNRSLGAPVFCDRTVGVRNPLKIRHVLSAREISARYFSQLNFPSEQIFCRGDPWHAPEISYPSSGENWVCLIECSCCMASLTTFQKRIIKMTSLHNSGLEAFIKQRISQKKNKFFISTKLQFLSNIWKLR